MRVGGEVKIFSYCGAIISNSPPTTHLSLYQSTPVNRPIQPPEQGRVFQVKRVRGLHHEYV